MKYSIISLEISYLKKGSLQDEKIIFTNCKELLTDLKLVKSESDIVEMKIEYFEHAYPIQTSNKKQIVTQDQKIFFEI